MNFKALNYFLAKYFGIVEYNGSYCIPSTIYVCDRDYEDDKIVEYKAVKGLQIFPVIKKVEKFNLTHDSIYRSYIAQHCKGEA